MYVCTYNITHAFQVGTYLKQEIKTTSYSFKKAEI